MRVCPKCGYSDPPVWRFAKYRRFTSYCRSDELEVWDPDLVKLIPKNGRVVEIEGYRYKIAKSGYISRIHTQDCMYPNSLKMDEPPQEHWREALRKKDWKNQTKLFNDLP